MKALRNKIRWVLIPFLCLMIAGAAGVYWFMLRDSAAAPLALRTQTSLSRTVSDAETNGQWTVVAGPSDQATTAGYRVKERVFGVGADTATGRTHGVTGSVTVADQRVTAAKFTVDMSTLKSNKSLRDSVLKTAAIETDKYPTATFTLTGPIALPDITPGKIYRVDARGRLQMHGVSNSVSVTLRYERTRTGIVVLADMPIVMADYGIKAPSVAGVVSVDNFGSLEVLANLTQTTAGQLTPTQSGHSSVASMG
jgi:polyisoprenoid-binding protein YceI